MHESKFAIGQNIMVARPEKSDPRLIDAAGVIKSKIERFSVPHQKCMVVYEVELNDPTFVTVELQEHELDLHKMKFEEGQEIVVSEGVRGGDYAWVEGEKGIIKLRIERLQAFEGFCDPAYVVELYNHPYRVFAIPEYQLAAATIEMEKAA